MIMIRKHPRKRPNRGSSTPWKMDGSAPLLHHCKLCSSRLSSERPCRVPGPLHRRHAGPFEPSAHPSWKRCVRWTHFKSGTIWQRSHCQGFPSNRISRMVATRSICNKISLSSPFIRLLLRSRTCKFNKWLSWWRWSSESRFPLKFSCFRLPCSSNRSRGSSSRSLYARESVSSCGFSPRVTINGDIFSLGFLLRSKCRKESCSRSSPNVNLSRASNLFPLISKLLIVALKNASLSIRKILLELRVRKLNWAEWKA